MTSPIWQYLNQFCLGLVVLTVYIHIYMYIYIYIVNPRSIQVHINLHSPARVQNELYMFPQSTGWGQPRVRCGVGLTCAIGSWGQLCAFGVTLTSRCSYELGESCLISWCSSVGENKGWAFAFALHRIVISSWTATFVISITIYIYIHTYIYTSSPKDSKIK